MGWWLQYGCNSGANKEQRGAHGRTDHFPSRRGCALCFRKTRKKRRAQRVLKRLDGESCRAHIRPPSMDSHGKTGSSSPRASMPLALALAVEAVVSSSTAAAAGAASLTLAAPLRLLYRPEPGYHSPEQHVARAVRRAGSRTGADCSPHGPPPPAVLSAAPGLTLQRLVLSGSLGSVWAGLARRIMQYGACMEGCGLYM
jgi:hypothetical protein